MPRFSGISALLQQVEAGRMNATPTVFPSPYIPPTDFAPPNPYGFRCAQSPTRGEGNLKSTLFALSIISIYEILSIIFLFALAL
jgi:hypothetical protein